MPCLTLMPTSPWQIPRPAGRNQQLPGSHVAHLHHLPLHWLRRHGPPHLLREGGLPAHRHHGKGCAEPLLCSVGSACPHRGSRATCLVRARGIMASAPRSCSPGAVTAVAGSGGISRTRRRGDGGGSAGWACGWRVLQSRGVPCPTGPAAEFGWIWTCIGHGRGEPDRGSAGDGPREQRGPRASPGSCCSHHLLSIARSNPRCCRLLPRAGTGWEPSAPPRSCRRHRLAVASSPGGQKVTVLRRLQRHLLQGRPRPPGSRGFPAGAAEGTAPADVPSTRLCSPQLRAPRVAPCPLPSQGSLGWHPALSALPPRPSRCPRWLHWWVLVSHLPAFALSRVSSGASEADPVGGREGREKTPLGGGRRRFAAAGSAEGLPVARTLRPPLHRAATQRSVCLAAGMGPRDAAAGAAPVPPGGDVVGARSARQDLLASSGIQLGAR